MEEENTVDKADKVDTDLTNESDVICLDSEGDNTLAADKNVPAKLTKRGRKGGTKVPTTAEGTTLQPSCTVVTRRRSGKPTPSKDDQPLIKMMTRSREKKAGVLDTSKSDEPVDKAELQCSLALDTSADEEEVSIAKTALEESHSDGKENNNTEDNNDVLQEKGEATDTQNTAKTEISPSSKPDESRSSSDCVIEDKEATCSGITDLPDEGKSENCEDNVVESSLRGESSIEPSSLRGESSIEPSSLRGESSIEPSSLREESSLEPSSFEVDMIKIQFADVSNYVDAAAILNKVDVVDVSNKVITADISNEVDITDISNKVDTVDISNEVDIADVSKKVDAADVSKKVDAAGISKKVDVVDVSNKVITVDISNEVDITDISNKVDGADISNEADVADMSNKVDVADVSNKVDVADVSNKVDAADISNEADVADVSNKVDTTYISNKVDVADVSNKVDVGDASNEVDVSSTEKTIDIQHKSNSVIDENNEKQIVVKSPTPKDALKETQEQILINSGETSECQVNYLDCSNVDNDMQFVSKIYEERVCGTCSDDDILELDYDEEFAVHSDESDAATLQQPDSTVAGVKGDLSKANNKDEVTDESNVLKQKSTKRISVLNIVYDTDDLDTESDHSIDISKFLINFNKELLKSPTTSDEIDADNANTMASDDVESTCDVEVIEDNCPSNITTSTVVAVTSGDIELSSNESDAELRGCDNKTVNDTSDHLNECTEQDSEENMEIKETGTEAEKVCHIAKVNDNDTDVNDNKKEVDQKSNKQDNEGCQELESELPECVVSDGKINKTNDRMEVDAMALDDNESIKQSSMVVSDMEDKERDSKMSVGITPKESLTIPKEKAVADKAVRDIEVITLDDDDETTEGANQSGIIINDKENEKKKNESNVEITAKNVDTEEYGKSVKAESVADDTMTDTEIFSFLKDDNAEDGKKRKIGQSEEEPGKHNKKIKECDNIMKTVCEVKDLEEFHKSPEEKIKIVKEIKSKEMLGKLKDKTNDKKEIKKTTDEGLAASGKLIFSEKIGVDAQYGPFARLIIVGDYYVKELSSCWPSKSKMKPYFLSAANLSINDLYMALVDHSFLKNCDGKIMIIAIIGMHDIIPMKGVKSPKCNVKHPYVKLPCKSLGLVKQDITPYKIVEGFSRVKEQLKSANKQTFLVYAYIPSVNIINTGKKILSKQKTSYTHCRCSIIMSPLNGEKCNTETENLIESCNQLIFAKKLTHLPGKRFFNFTPVDIQHHDSRWTSLSDTNMVKNAEELENKLNLVIHGRIGEFKVSIDTVSHKLEEASGTVTSDSRNKINIYFIGDTWLKSVSDLWEKESPVKPKFYFEPNMNLNSVKKMILSLSNDNTKNLIITNVCCSDMIQYDRFNNCVDHSPLIYAVPKSKLIDDYDAFAEDIIRSVKEMQSEVYKRRKNLKIVFMTCYPVIFPFLYKYLVEQHLEKMNHDIKERLVEFKDCAVHADNLKKCFQVVNEKLIKINMENNFHSCDIYSLLLLLSRVEKANFLYPLFIRDKSPSSAMAEKLTMLIREYVESINLLHQKGKLVFENPSYEESLNDEPYEESVDGVPYAESLDDAPFDEVIFGGRSNQKKVNHDYDDISDSSDIPNDCTIEPKADEKAKPSAKARLSFGGEKEKPYRVEVISRRQPNLDSYDGSSRYQKQHQIYNPYQYESYNSMQYQYNLQYNWNRPPLLNNPPSIGPDQASGMQLGREYEEIFRTNELSQMTAGTDIWSGERYNDPANYGWNQASSIYKTHSDGQEINYMSGQRHRSRSRDRSSVSRYRGRRSRSVSRDRRSRSVKRGRRSRSLSRRRSYRSRSRDQRSKNYGRKSRSRSGSTYRRPYGQNKGTLSKAHSYRSRSRSYEHKSTLKRRYYRSGSRNTSSDSDGSASRTTKSRKRTLKSAHLLYSKRHKLLEPEKRALDDLWDIHNRECEKYRSNPEIHPDHDRLKRMWTDAMVLQGYDPTSYTLAHEWKSYWKKKMEKLFSESWKEKKNQCLKLLPTRKSSFVSSSTSSDSSGDTSDSESKRNHDRHKKKSKLKKDEIKDFIKYSFETAKNMSVDVLESRVNEYIMKQSCKESSQSEENELSSTTGPEKLSLNLFDVTTALSRISDRFGALGISINTLHQKVSDAIEANKDPMQYIDDDARVLFTFIEDKVKRILRDRNLSVVQRAIIQEVYDRFCPFFAQLNQLDEKEKPYFGLDIDSIARATEGNSTLQIAEFIKKSLEYRNVHDVSQDKLYQLYIKVKQSQIEHEKSSMQPSTSGQFYDEASSKFSSVSRSVRESESMSNVLTANILSLKPSSSSSSSRRSNVSVHDNYKQSEYKSGRHLDKETSIRQQFMSLPLHEKLLKFSSFNSLSFDEQHFLMDHLEELGKTDEKLALSLRVMLGKSGLL